VGKVEWVDFTVGCGGILLEFELLGCVYGGGEEGKKVK